MFRIGKKRTAEPRRQVWLQGAIGAAILVSACADKGAKPQADDTSANPSAPAQTTPKWIYTSQQDAMRGTTAKGAFLDSSNSMPLGRGNSAKVELILRSSAQSGSAMFRINNSYFYCNPYASDTISIKFDDDPVREFRCADSSDGNSHITYIDKDVQFIRRLKTSKSMIAEIPVLDHGRVQFFFDTKDLVWE